MILYHGTTLVIPNPEIVKTEAGRDFGFAFYTTDIREQAIRWARRKAMLQGRKSRQVITPVITEYMWDENSTENLEMKYFEGASLNWLEMIVRCRSDVAYTHGYDIVIGKIANDNVGETVSYVLQGIMRKEDAVERLKFEKINNQIAFCTPKALEYLKYNGFFEG